MLNEEFIRAVLAEKARDREVSTHLHALRADHLAPARHRRSLRRLLRFPRFPTRNPRTRRAPRPDVRVTLRVVPSTDDVRR